jgi:hypothetical protein
MRHPDEGTIHTWLDGELPADEASALEAHIAECPECSARAAEARGLAAASSRIVSALDIVPGGVIPAAAPKGRKWFATAQFRAAAAAVIVAGASFLVMRGRDKSAMDSIMTTASSPAPAVSPSSADAQRDLMTAPQEQAAAPPPAGTTAPKKSEVAKVAEGSVRSEPSPGPLSAAQNTAAQLEGAVAGVRTGVTDSSHAADALALRRRVTDERDFTGKGVRGGVARGAARSPVLPEFPRVRTDSIQSGSRTVFELSPGIEVTLIDAAPAAADALVKQKEIAVSAPAPPPPAAAMAKPDSSPQMPINTITWVDKRGHSMTLTGRVSVLQLQVLRQQLPEDQR